jgi:hypothetical protein
VRSGADAEHADLAFSGATGAMLSQRSCSGVQPHEPKGMGFWGLGIVVAPFWIRFLADG